MDSRNLWLFCIVEIEIVYQTIRFSCFVVEVISSHFRIGIPILRYTVQ